VSNSIFQADNSEYADGQVVWSLVDALRGGVPGDAPEEGDMFDHSRSTSYASSRRDSESLDVFGGARTLGRGTPGLTFRHRDRGRENVPRPETNVSEIFPLADHRFISRLTMMSRILSITYRMIAVPRGGELTFTLHRRVFPLAHPRHSHITLHHLLTRRTRNSKTPRPTTRHRARILRHLFTLFRQVDSVLNGRCSSAKDSEHTGQWAVIVGFP
jgi:hypothetical protein